MSVGYLASGLLGTMAPVKSIEQAVLFACNSIEQTYQQGIQRQMDDMNEYAQFVTLELSHVVEFINQQMSRG